MEENNNTSVMEPPKKLNAEDYDIVKCDNRPGLYRISPKVGRTPNALSGCYTSSRFAKEAIEFYVNKKNSSV